MREANRATSLAEAAVRGAIAGVAGGLVLKAAWSAEERLLPPARRVESPTTEVVERQAEAHAVQISRGQAQAAAGVGYLGSMALWGAVYGVVQTRLHPPMLAHGLLLGGLVYAANFSRVGALRRMGVLPAPSETVTGESVPRIAAHAAFGLTTAAVFEALA